MIIQSIINTAPSQETQNAKVVFLSLLCSFVLYQNFWIFRVLDKQRRNCLDWCHFITSCLPGPTLPLSVLSVHCSLLSASQHPGEVTVSISGCLLAPLGWLMPLHFCSSYPQYLWCSSYLTSSSSSFRTQPDASFRKLHLILSSRVALMWQNIVPPYDLIGSIEMFYLHTYLHVGLLPRWVQCQCYRLMVTERYLTSTTLKT